jgi:DNA-binding transcriptional ArsR family regulator
MSHSRLPARFPAASGGFRPSSADRRPSRRPSSPWPALASIFVEPACIRRFVGLILNCMVQYASRRLDASFAALSDATRRGVLEQLGRADASITDLAQTFHMTLTGMRKHVGCSGAGRARHHGEGRARADLPAQPSPTRRRDGMDRSVPQALGLTLRRVGQGCRGNETEGEGRWTQREIVSPPP